MNPSDPSSSSSKSAKGCVIGCLAALVIVPLIVFFTGYMLLMHSSVPLKIVAGLASKADGLTIEGIDGSISKGFTIEEMRVTDSQGNESTMTGLALKWQDLRRLGDQELIIEEVALERARLYFDFNNSKDGDSTAASSSTGGTSTSTTMNGEELKLFEIRKIDIRELVIASSTGDSEFKFDEILLEGLRVEDNDFQLESLSVGSDFIDLELEDAEPVEHFDQTLPFTRRVRGTLKPTLHESMTQPVEFAADFGAVDGEMTSRLRIEDDIVEVFVLGGSRQQSITIQNFRPGDYFTEDFRGLVDKLSLSASSPGPDPTTGVETITVESGSFTIGKAEFTIATQTLVETEPEADPLDGGTAIVATSDHGGLAITATLERHDGPPFYRVSLESQPASQPRELLALLLFDKPLAELSPEEQTEVDAAAARHASQQPSEP